MNTLDQEVRQLLFHFYGIHRFNPSFGFAQREFNSAAWSIWVCWRLTAMVLLLGLFSLLFQQWMVGVLLVGISPIPALFSKRFYLSALEIHSARVVCKQHGIFKSALAKKLSDYVS